MPRVTVIIPARDAAAHIEEALRSLVSQTFGDWEAIVVDDGSADDTAAIASGIDDRIRVRENPTPGGPAAARNVAITEARGELLALLDADDQWLPEYIERQLGRFDAEQRAGGRVGIVACDALILDDGRVLREPYSAFAGSPREATLETLLRFNPIFISVLAPRAVVIEAGGFEPATFGSADHDLWIRILELSYRVVFNHEPLAIYRKHHANISRDSVAMARTSELVYRRALERGRLDPRQRRLARRSLRLQRGVCQVERLLAYPSLSRAPAAAWIGGARGALALAWYGLTSPRRWPEWAGKLARGRWNLWRPKWDA